MHINNENKTAIFLDGVHCNWSLFFRDEKNSWEFGMAKQIAIRANPNAICFPPVK